MLNELHRLFFNISPLDIAFLLVLFQLKHWVADYPLQNEYMLQKFLDVGWKRPLAAHAACHAAFTAAITVGMGAPPFAVVLLSIFDFSTHFLVDRFKASSKMLGRYKALASSEFVPLKVELARLNTIAPEGHVQIDAIHRKLKGNKYFWWALGLDQGLHHLTHYVILFVILMFNQPFKLTWSISFSWIISNI